MSWFDWLFKHLRDDDINQSSAALPRHSRDEGHKQLVATAEPASNVEESRSVRRKRLPRPERTELPPLTGIIRGTANIGFEIVGESYFQAALRKIRNSRCMAEDNDFEAFIVTEPNNPHDTNACAVFIDGFKVGYLPRDAAASFVAQIADQGIHGVSCFQLRAKLVGGFGSRLNIGVMVNLPLGDE